MLGDVRPWNLALAAVRQSFIGADDDKGWRCTGRSRAGEQVWERTFQLKGRPDVYLVTVIVDPAGSTTRALYAAPVAEGDRVPRVPGVVRRKTDAFLKRIQSAARRDQQRSP